MGLSDLSLGGSWGRRRLVLEGTEFSGSPGFGGTPLSEESHEEKNKLL